MLEADYDVLMRTRPAGLPSARLACLGPLPDNEITRLASCAGALSVPTHAVRRPHERRRRAGTFKRR